MPVPPRRNTRQLVVVSCDSFTVTPDPGNPQRLLVELVGATPTDYLPPHRQYLTPRQLSEVLRTHSRNLRRIMAGPNPVPYVRFGTAPRFVLADVKRWAKEGRSISARRAHAALLETSPEVLVSPRTPKAAKLAPRGGCPRCEGNMMVRIEGQGVVPCPECYDRDAAV